jgi:hypothetical protein
VVAEYAAAEVFAKFKVPVTVAIFRASLGMVRAVVLNIAGADQLSSLS